MNVNDAQPKESQRKQVRYAVSEDCRLRASLRVQSSEPGMEIKDWPGTLVDMSATGAHIQISMAAVAYQGDGCTLKLAHGAMKVELRCTLMHYICSARYSVCGVRFDYALDQVAEPFLKAIVASSALKAGEMTAESGRYREEYLGPGYTKLVVWRDNKPERAVVEFDYTMARFGAALAAAGPDMFRNKEMVGFKAAPTERGPASAPLVKSEEVEARWEFSVAASNLPKIIPPDIRKFLRLVS